MYRPKGVKFESSGAGVNSEERRSLSIEEDQISMQRVLDLIYPRQFDVG